MSLATKQMIEKSRTGMLDWISLWPTWTRMISEMFAEMKEDNEYVGQYIKDNNITVSVVTFTNVFGWLGQDLPLKL